MLARPLCILEIYVNYAASQRAAFSAAPLDITLSVIYYSVIKLNQLVVDVC